MEYAPVPTITEGCQSADEYGVKTGWKNDQLHARPELIYQLWMELNAGNIK